MDEEEWYANQRDRMVETQLVPRDISDPRVLQAMRAVPRHRFVPPEHQRYAYADGPLPIGYGQTISQPYIVALMTQLLALEGCETALEVGTGSGYQAAVLGLLAAQVHTIERHPPLADSAALILAELGYRNVQVHSGDGTLGLAELSPFAAIAVTAAAPRVPQALLDQLAPGGRLVIPVGSRGGQILELWQRQEGELRCEAIIPVAFVPLVGRYGWRGGEDG
jgi:protein-L-isoaspartate(D-aspartate) O-methyltransferase